jgi:hypothetical protein
MLSSDKLLEFSSGFTEYTASTTDADVTGSGAQLAQDAFVDLLLDPKGNLMQVREEVMEERRGHWHSFASYYQIGCVVLFSLMCS